MEDYNINLSGQCSILKVRKKCHLNTSDYFFGLQLLLNDFRESIKRSNIRAKILWLIDRKLSELTVCGNSFDSLQGRKGVGPLESSLVRGQSVWITANVNN